MERFAATRRLAYYKEWLLENCSPEFLSTLIFALVLLGIIVVPQLILVKEGTGGTAEQQFEEIRMQQRRIADLRRRRVANQEK